MAHAEAESLLKALYARMKTTQKGSLDVLDKLEALLKDAGLGDNDIVLLVRPGYS